MPLLSLPVPGKLMEEAAAAVVVEAAPRRVRGREPNKGGGEEEEGEMRHYICSNAISITISFTNGIFEKVAAEAARLGR